MFAFPGPAEEAKNNMKEETKKREKRSTSSKEAKNDKKSEKFQAQHQHKGKTGSKVKFLIQKAKWKKTKNLVLLIGFKISGTKC